MSFWGVTLKACEAYTLTPESPLHVTKAVLAAESAPAKGRNMVQCRVGDSDPVCVCSLRAETEEQTSLDLVFEQGTAVTFLTSGPGTVALTGYFVQHFVEAGDQNDDDEDDEDYVDDGDDDDDDDDDDEEVDEEDEEEEEEEEEKEEEKPEKEEKKEEEEEEKGKKRSRDAESAKTQPQKRVCASPEAPARKSTPGDKPKSVHFDDAKSAPATPSRPRTAPAHPQTPYSRSTTTTTTTTTAATATATAKRAVPDTIVPTPATPQSAAKKKDAPRASTAAASPAASAAPATRRTPEGLTITDTRVGTGAVARPGCTVQVRYTGALTSGKVFDKSGRTPFRFDLGTGEVIRGWDLGVKDMRVGGKRRLVVPPHLGYGHSRAGPIPPNSTLVFDVELVSVH